MKTAVIAGATGLVGKQLMFKLLESTSYEKVIILVRTFIHIKHPKLIQVIVNFESLSAYKDQLKGDDFFCCLGTTMKRAGSKEAFYKVDYSYCLEFARLASENNAQKFLLISAIGADASSSIYYSKVKGELENAIRGLTISAIHIFHPSVLVGNRLEFRFGEIIGIAMAKTLSPLMLGSLSKYKPIEVTELADSMLKIAQLPLKEKVTTWNYKQMMSVIS